MKRPAKLVVTAAVVLLVPLLIADKGGKKAECVPEALRFSGPLGPDGYTPTVPGDIDSLDGLPIEGCWSSFEEVQIDDDHMLKLHRNVLTANLVPDEEQCLDLRVGEEQLPYWEGDKCYYCRDGTPGDPNDPPDGWCDERFYGQTQILEKYGRFDFDFDTRAPGDPSLGGLEVCASSDLPPDDPGFCRYRVGLDFMGMSDGEDMSVETPMMFAFQDMTTAEFQFHEPAAGEAWKHIVGHNPVRGTILDFAPHQTSFTDPVTKLGTITGDIESQGAEVEIGFNVWTYGPLPSPVGWMALHLSQNLLMGVDDGVPYEHLEAGPYYGKARLTVLSPASFRNDPHRFDFHFDEYVGCRAPTREELPLGPTPAPGVCRYALIVQYGTPDREDVVFSAPNTQVFLIDWTQEWNRGPWYPYDPYVNNHLVDAGPYCVAGHNAVSPEGITIVFASGEPAQENCKNGIDDDGDGLVDCYDPDCSSKKFCK